MKTTEIDWPLFWSALRQQQAATKERWLARWLFADDVVKLSQRVGGERKRKLTFCGADGSFAGRL